MPTLVRSFSKINLGLAVGPRRTDGYHDLATCYQTLALYDRVTVTARRTSVTSLWIEADHPGVPRSETGDAERNTAWKMVTGALERLGITAEVEIRIEKLLPVQGGLGAGSANAAAALLGLERELGVALPGPERLLLAAEVGSDVPLFLLGGTVLGLGRGEEVSPLPDLPEVPCVVAVPPVGVSTARAFQELDTRAGLGGGAAPDRLTLTASIDRLKQLSRALAAVWTTSGADRMPSWMLPGQYPLQDLTQDSEPSLTGIAQANGPELSSGTPLYSGTSPQGSDGQGDLAETMGFPPNLLEGVPNALLALVRTGMENDFEEVVFSEHPSLRSTKRDLMGSGPGGLASGTEGALYAALSGSGSALFGLYRTQADAEAAQRRVEASGTRAIVTSTISRPRYWRTPFR